MGSSSSLNDWSQALIFEDHNLRSKPEVVFFFFTLGKSPRRSLSLKLSDTRVYAPQIRVTLVNIGSGGGELITSEAEVPGGTGMVTSKPCSVSSLCPVQNLQINSGNSSTPRIDIRGSQPVQ